MVLHVETLYVVIISDCMVDNSVVNNRLTIGQVRGVMDNFLVNNWLNIVRHAMKHDVTVIRS